MRSGFIALAGWTNVGKSTLLNRLVGQKIAAVADVPQTTRHRISGVLHLPGRAQIVFVDTPGFHQPRERMQRAMVDAARRALEDVDVACLIVDAAHGIGDGDARAASIVRSAAKAMVVVLNKVDLVRPKTALLPMMARVAESWGVPDVLPVSAKGGEGCDELVDHLAARLPEGEPPFPDDYLTDQPERTLAAEMVREKLLHHTRQEIPHAVAVLIRSWTVREDGLVAIDACIVVDRDSQKGIVIGKGGALLKAVGTEARKDIETMLDAKVFLSLHVEVRSDWRNDERILRELGIR